MNLFRRLFFCWRNRHRIGMNVDHNTLTLLACRDCGKPFKFTDLAS